MQILNTHIRPYNMIQSILKIGKISSILSEIQRRKKIYLEKLVNQYINNLQNTDKTQEDQ